MTRRKSHILWRKYIIFTHVKIYNHYHSLIRKFINKSHKLQNQGFHFQSPYGTLIGNVQFRKKRNDAASICEDIRKLQRGDYVAETDKDNVVHYLLTVKNDLHIC